MWVCKTVIGGIISEGDTGRINWNQIKNYYYYAPGGSSVRNLIHWMQIINSDSIRMFNFGKEKNLLKYNSEIPPHYDLNKLKNFKKDIFITNSETDPYSTPEDFDHMFEILENSNKVIKKLGNYNHGDYLWSSTAPSEIYQHVLEFLNKN